MSPDAKRRAALIDDAIRAAQEQIETLAHTVNVLHMAQNKPMSIFTPAVTAFERARIATGLRVDTLYDLVKDGREVIPGETFDHTASGRRHVPPPDDGRERNTDPNVKHWNNAE